MMVLANEQGADGAEQQDPADVHPALGVLAADLELVAGKFQLVDPDLLVPDVDLVPGFQFLDRLTIIVAERGVL